MRKPRPRWRTVAGYAFGGGAAFTAGVAAGCSLIGIAPFLYAALAAVTLAIVATALLGEDLFP